MNSHLRDRVAAFVDGQLDFAGREKALEHLSRCAECRAAVEQERWVKTRVQNLPSAEPSADLLSSLTRVSRGQPAPDREPRDHWPVPRGRARRSGLLLAGAGSLAAGFVGIAYVVGGATAAQAPVSPPVGQFSVEFAGAEHPLPFADPAMDVLPVIDHEPSEGGR